jgi:DNA-binding GntR family transcriptional regulator
MDIYEVRIALAGTVAAGAAERASEAQIENIRSLVPKMWGANSASDIDAINDLTEAFHRALVNTTANETLSKTYLALLSAHRLFRVGAIQKLGNFDKLVTENNRKAIEAREELIEAISLRDSSKAARLYVKYFEDSRRRSLEKYSEAFSLGQGQTA